MSFTFDSTCSACSVCIDSPDSDSLDQSAVQGIFFHETQKHLSSCQDRQKTAIFVEGAHLLEAAAAAKHIRLTRVKVGNRSTKIDSQIPAAS